MTRRSLAVLALLLGGCAHRGFTFSPEAARAGMLLPRPMTHFTLFATLESGLRVVAYRFEGEPDVELVLSFQGGTSAEPPGKEGLASLAASLADQATPGRGGVRIDERLYAAGVVSRWAWSEDELVLRVTVKQAKLREVIQIEGWRLQDPATGITEQQVARVREYLAAELERERASHLDEARVVEGRALQGTPYGRRPPTPEGLRKLTLKDVRDYLQQVIRPERAVLTVASGDQADGTMKVAMEITPRRPSGAAQGAAMLTAFDPPAVAGSTERMVMRADKRRLWLAWAIPGSHALDEPLLRIAAGYLRSAAVDRLKEEGLRDQIGEVTAVARWRESAGVILVSVVLKTGADAERIRPVVERSAELAQERIKRDLASRRAAELSRQQLQLERYVADEGRVPIMEVARSLRATGESTPSSGFERALNSLLDGSGRIKMAGFLARKPSAAVLIDREDQAPVSPPDQLATTQADLGWGEYTPFDRGAAPGADGVRTLLTPPGLDKARRQTLANGLEVAVLVRKGTPFAQSALEFRGTNGSSETQRARMYLATATAALPRACGMVTASAGVDGARLRVATTAEGLRFGLETLACWLTVSDAGAKEGDMTPALRTRYQLADASFLASAPPAVDDQPRWGDRWARRTMRPVNAKLVVAGDVDPETVFTMAAQVFGGWASRPESEFPALPPAPAPAPVARTTVVYDQKGNADGWLTLILRATGGSPGTEADQSVLAQVMEARLEKVLVLGEFKVAVSAISAEGMHVLQVRIKGRSDRLGTALKRALDELASLDSSLDDPLAIATARWNVARGWAFAFNRTSQVALHAARLASAGLPPDGYEHLGEQIAGVTSARLRAAMSLYSLGKEGIRIGGPFDALAPRLKELGLDPIRVPEEPEKPKD